MRKLVGKQIGVVHSKQHHKPTEGVPGPRLNHNLGHDAGVDAGICRDGHMLRAIWHITSF